MSNIKYGEDGFRLKPMTNDDHEGIIWHFWSDKTSDHGPLEAYLIIARKENTRRYEIWSIAPNHGNRWYNNYKVVSTHPSLKAAKTTILMLKASQ
jgi:hypothetical protein